MSSTGSPNVRPTCSTIRPATVRAPATETCWPITARTAVSYGSTLAGARRPGTAATSGASAVSDSERCVHGGRVAVEIEQTADALDGDAEVAPRRQLDASSDVVVVRDEPDDADATGQVERTAIRLAVPRLDTRDRALADERHQLARRERLPNGEPHRDRNSALDRRRRDVDRDGRADSSTRVVAVECGRRAARSSVGEVANTSRIVSLNCRTLPNPAAKATSVNGNAVVSTSNRAVCARWARATASGPAPSSSVNTRFRWRSL